MTRRPLIIASMPNPMPAPIPAAVAINDSDEPALMSSRPYSSTNDRSSNAPNTPPAASPHNVPFQRESRRLTVSTSATTNFVSALPAINDSDDADSSAMVP